MTEWWIVVAIGTWILCGVLTHGLSFAFFQRAFPSVAEELYCENKRFCLGLSLIGPVALIAWAIICLSRRAGGDQAFYGFKFF